MSHELATKQNGQAAMAYVGETPWHDLGQKLEAGASIEQWKQAAGFDWAIKRSPVLFSAHCESTLPVSFKERHVLYRSDTSAPLSVVSSDYKVVQPGAMLEFFRDLVATAGFVLETAGVLFDGKRMWVLARVTDDATIIGGDRVGGYLLLSTACDGSMATTGRFTTIRVVCNNTLSMSLSRDNKTVVRVPHSATFNADAMKAQLGIGVGAFNKFIVAAKTLASQNIGARDAEIFTSRLLYNTETVKVKDAKNWFDADSDVRQSAAFGKIISLFNGAGRGSDMQGSKGTLWGLVNGVTEYVDHHARASSVDNRLNRAWFGEGDKLKTAALEEALAM